MLDKTFTPIAHAVIRPLVSLLDSLNITPDQITVFGFFIGIIGVPFIAFEHYIPALVCILINRVCDGIDGELARRQNNQSDAGAFLDISLDFVFYAFIPLGFIFANVEQNGLVGGALIFAFMGTGSSFLAFAIMAEKHKIERVQFKNKSFHYINGLAEGTETILFFIAFCLFPDWFPVLAWMFFTICIITTATRVIGGYKTIKRYCANFDC